jgi:hypothetical protein
MNQIDTSLFFGWLSNSFTSAGKMISNGVLLSLDSWFWDYFDDKYTLKLPVQLVRDTILIS